jgi:hypothetical protein
MTSARELLEQADALMRRARNEDEELPVLDDVVSGAFDAPPPTSDGPLIVPSPASPSPASGAPGSSPTSGASAPSSTSNTPSNNQPAREDGVPASSAGASSAADESTGADASAASRDATGAVGVAASLFAPVELPPRSLDELIPGLSEPATAEGTGAGSGSLRVAERATWSGSPAAGLAAQAQSAGSAKPARVAADGRELSERSDELFMSVVQRLDLLIERRLAQQLETGIRPLVERASEAMVERLRSDLRDTLRGWVAEAIEQELAASRAAPAPLSPPKLR